MGASKKMANEGKYDGERFSGLARLYGLEQALMFADRHVMIVGIGGVGSWSSEALVRSGVGRITLVDGDDVCVTNTNRQVHAVALNVGRPKVVAMAARMAEIWPDCEVRAEALFFDRDSAPGLLDESPDLVIDAIDNLSAKCYLLAECHRRGIPIVAVGGAGGKGDPTKVATADLSEAVNDPLLRKVRRELRRDHGFPGAGCGLFGIPSVYSTERPVFPQSGGSVCWTREPGSSLRLDCASGFGTAAFVTGAFGFAAVALGLEKLIADWEGRSSMG